MPSQCWKIFLFLGFHENNWEVPQVWFAGALFLKVLYTYVETAKKLEVKVGVGDDQR